VAQGWAVLPAGLAWAAPRVTVEAVRLVLGEGGVSFTGWVGDGAPLTTATVGWPGIEAMATGETPWADTASEEGERRVAAGGGSARHPF
jgi:hypothetical protein